jgi:hypothetical protein
MMADYPCDLHQARYVGESTRAYLNLYRGDEVAAFRASLCGECLAELMTAWLEHALAKDEDGRWAYPEPPHQLEGVFRPRTGPSANGATWTRV